MALLLVPAFAAAQPVGKSFDSLEALSADARLVVRGRLLSVARDPVHPIGVDWDDAAFKVDEYLKGSGPAVIRFQIRGANNGDPRVHNLVKNKAPLLGFFSESVRFGSRKASRFEFAPRTGIFGGSFVDLSPSADPQIMTPDFRAVTGPEAILSLAKRAVATTAKGTYRVASEKVPQEKVPKGYQAPWVYLTVPVPIPAAEVLRPDCSRRFGPDAQYDGRRIIAARGKDAMLWDASTGKLIRRFSGSAEDVQAVCFCPPEPYGPPSGSVLTGSGLPNGILGLSKDNEIRQWSIDTGAVEKTFGPLMGPVESLVYAPQGDRFMSRSVESSDWDRFRQRMWEGFGRTEVCLLPGFGAVYSPDGSMVASRSHPYIAASFFAGVWDMNGYLQLCSLPGDRSYMSLDFSRYGNRLVTTSIAGTDRFSTEVWNAEKGTELLRMVGSKGRQAAFTRDCTKVVTAEHNEGLAVWDASTGKRIRTVPLPGASREFLMSPDGSRCLAKWGRWSNFGDDQGVALVDLGTGKILLRLDGIAAGLVGFSADGATLFGFDSPYSGTVWDARTGSVASKLSLAKE